MQQGEWKMIIIISSCYIQSNVVQSASITAMENQYKYCERERLGRGKGLSEKVYNEVWVQWTKIEWITEVRGYPSSMLTAILVELHSLGGQSPWDRDITAVYVTSSYLLPHGRIPAAWPPRSGKFWSSEGVFYSTMENDNETIPSLAHEPKKYIWFRKEWRHRLREKKHVKKKPSNLQAIRFDKNKHIK